MVLATSLADVTLWSLLWDSSPRSWASWLTLGELPVCVGIHLADWRIHILMLGPGLGGLRVLGTSGPSTCLAGYPLVILSWLTLGGLWALPRPWSAPSSCPLASSPSHLKALYLVFCASAVPFALIGAQALSFIHSSVSPPHSFQSQSLSIFSLALFKSRKCSGLEMKRERLINISIIYIFSKSLELQRALPSLTKWLFLQLEEQRPTWPSGL